VLPHSKPATPYDKSYACGFFAPPTAEVTHWNKQLAYVQDMFDALCGLVTIKIDSDVALQLLNSLGRNLAYTPDLQALCLKKVTLCCTARLEYQTLSDSLVITLKNSAFAKLCKRVRIDYVWGNTITKREFLIRA
jgi:hypothetical protein